MNSLRVCRARRAQGDDRSRGGRGGEDCADAHGDHRQQPGGHPQADPAAGGTGSAALLLRGRAHRLRDLPSAHRSGRELPGGGTIFGAASTGRSGEDGPSGCAEAGAWLAGGTLTPIWVPDPADEAVRDLVRAPEDGLEDLLRARHRLSKLLLRAGVRPPPDLRSWSAKHRQWLAQITLPPLAQQFALEHYLCSQKTFAVAAPRF